MIKTIKAMNNFIRIYFYLVCVSLLSADDKVNGAGAQLPQASSYLPEVVAVVFALPALAIFLLYRSKQRLSRILEEQTVEVEHHRSHLLEQVDEAALEKSQWEFEAINRIVSSIEYRDIETANHMVRMANYCRLIAKQIYPPDSPMVGLIVLAAPMHDVGKIGISDKILSKPDPLDPREYDEMKRHALIGYDILKDSSSRVIQLGAIIALTHHERYDGTGYPQGLKGKDIPIAGRIIAVADYFDALVSKRAYKDAWPVEKAIERLKQHSGTYFDPLCVDAFLRSLDEIIEIKNQYSDYNKTIKTAS
ncbi:MAG: HD domain-containing protein [bacterium]|nr:HD domain-containing protein [bacterium]